MTLTTGAVTVSISALRLTGEKKASGAVIL